MSLASLSQGARGWLAFDAKRRAGTPKRRRGGQPGNRNRWRHGARSAEALLRRAELSSLLADVKRALEVCKPFIRLRNRDTPLAAHDVRLGGFCSADLPRAPAAGGRGQRPLPPPLNGRLMVFLSTKLALPRFCQSSAFGSKPLPGFGGAFFPSPAGGLATIETLPQPNAAQTLLRRNTSVEPVRHAIAPKRRVRCAAPSGDLD